MITQQNTTLQDTLIENPKKYKNLTIFPIIGRNYSNNCSVFHDVINDDSLEISEIDVSGLKIDSVQSYLESEFGMEPELDVYEFYRTGHVKFNLSGKLDKELHYYLSIRDEQGELAAFDIISKDPIKEPFAIGAWTLFLNL